MNLPYAASYARSATPDAAGIREQHARNAHAALLAGYHIPPGSHFHFEDDNTSGLMESRVGLDRLRAIVESGTAPFETIFIEDRRRLGRFPNLRRSMSLELDFRDHNVPLRFVRSRANLWPATASGGRGDVGDD